MRHEAALAAGGAAAGLLFCFYAGYYFRIAFVCTAAVLLCLGLLLLEGRVRKAMLTVLFSALIFGIYGSIYMYISVDRLTALSGETVTVSGIVTDCDDSDRAVVTISGNIGGISGKVNVYMNSVNISPGDRVTFDGIISEITDSATFSARSYYYSKGIFVNCSQSGDVAVEKASGIYALYGGMRELREKLTTEFCAFVGLDEGQFLSSMLCGTRDNLRDTVKTSLNRSGIGHLLSVSGLHVSIIAALAAYLFKLLKAPRIASFAVSEAVMAFFVVFSGMRISAVRAFVMMTIFLFSSVIRRHYDCESALGCAVLVILAASPYSVADGSFLLSIAGVAGVGIVEPAVSKAFGIRGRINRAAMSALCTYICVLPVSVFMFDEISLVSILTNVLLTPFCTVALVLALIFAICGTPAALSPLIEIAGTIVGWVIKICDYISDLGFTYITIKFAAVPVIVISLTAVVVLVLIISKNIRLASFAAVGAFCAVVIVIFAFGISDMGVTHLKIVSDGDGYLLTVIQGSECIAIDSDGSYSSDFGYIISEEGLTAVDAAVILNNGMANYSSYLSAAVAPDIILFDTSASTKSTQETEILKLTDGTTLALGDATILISGGNTYITITSKTLVITEDSISDADIPEDGYYLYISDGVCVTNLYGDVMVARDGVEMDF